MFGLKRYHDYESIINTDLLYLVSEYYLKMGTFDILDKKIETEARKAYIMYIDLGTDDELTYKCNTNEKYMEYKWVINSMKKIKDIIPKKGDEIEYRNLIFLPSGIYVKFIAYEDYMIIFIDTMYESSPMNYFIAFPSNYYKQTMALQDLKVLSKAPLMCDDIFYKLSLIKKLNYFDYIDTNKIIMANLNDPFIRYFYRYNNDEKLNYTGIGIIENLICF